MKAPLQIRIAPRKVFACVDEHGTPTIFFEQETYAKREASEMRGCGEPATVATYVLARIATTPRVRRKRTTSARPGGDDG